MSKKKSGFRSNLEVQIAAQLARYEVQYEYEKHKLEYQRNPSNYIPDFYLPEQDIFIEVKGRLQTSDRVKHQLLKEQHPDADIRFVFGNARNKIRKGSKTTYGEWADKFGIPWSDGKVPKEWIKK
jgi:hypothetical protein